MFTDTSCPAFKSVMCQDHHQSILNQKPSGPTWVKLLVKYFVFLSFLPKLKKYGHFKKCTILDHQMSEAIRNVVNTIYLS